MWLVARQGTSRWKGPEVGKDLACPRSRKGVSDGVASVLRERRPG